MNKKGVSGVVVTVLLILIGIAAIAILSTFILSFIRTNTERLELGVNLVQLTVDESNIHYGPSTLDIRVSRNSQSANVSGINFILTDESGNSYTYNYQGQISELESKTIQIPISEFITKIGKIEEISVAPVISSSTGKKFPGEPTDKYIVNSGFISNTGLMIYLPFDEDMNDKSGYGNNGACSGAKCPTLTQGKFGQAYLFNGNQNITVNGNLNPGAQITMIAWIKIAKYSDYARVMVKSEPSPINDVYSLYFGNSDRAKRITSGVYNQNGLVNYRPQENLTLNEWTFVAGKYDGSKIYVYINQSFVGNSSLSSGTILTSSRPLVIGCHDTYMQCFNGTIDEVRIYNRSLSEEEIYYLYKYN